MMRLKDDDDCDDRKQNDVSTNDILPLFLLLQCRVLNKTDTQPTYICTSVLFKISCLIGKYHRQCEQMARLFISILLLTRNNKNRPNSNFFAKVGWKFFQNSKSTLKIAKYYIFVKVA